MHKSEPRPNIRVTETYSLRSAQEVAGSRMVVQLKMAENHALLALPQDPDGEDGERAVEVELDVRLSALANAKALFAEKKELVAKLARTEQAKAQSLHAAQHRMLRLQVLPLPLLLLALLFVALALPC
jgi:prophage DNA circulation protein